MTSLTSYKNNNNNILLSRCFFLVVNPHPKAILVIYIFLYTLVSLLRRYNKYNFGLIA